MAIIGMGKLLKEGMGIAGRSLLAAQPKSTGIVRSYNCRYISAMFEWDDDKNATNIAKHGIGFERASQIFRNWVVTEIDERFDYGEVRQISIGLLEGVVVLAVVHTDRSGRIRIISARPANRAERKRYEEALQKRNDT